jgi:hypothetical protein
VVEFVGRGARGGAERATGAQTAGESGERVSEWVRRRLGFEADETQRAVLDSGARRGILCCTRQWGKSTVAAAMAVHTAATKAKSMVVIVAPTERHSGETLRKCEEFGSRLGWKTKGDGVNRLSLEAPNGSRIVGLPGTEAAVRGYSAPALLIVDEAALVKEETYEAAKPMLAASRGGRLWLISTPRGPQGYFYETWARGGKEWHRVRVTAEECPRISREFLDEQRRAEGDSRYRQEYLCEFVSGERSAIPAELVEASVTMEWKGEISI